jgi:hypothetical protein
MTPIQVCPASMRTRAAGGSRTLLVRHDVWHTGVRVEAVHQDRWNRRHRLHRPVFNEIRGDHQKRIHLMIMERGLVLVITIMAVSMKINK